MLRTVILLSGFNNWGKTYLLSEYFGVDRFYAGNLYKGFWVLPGSNDDVGYKGYLKQYEKHLAAYAKKGQIPPRLIISAFCPTREPNNESMKLIKALFSRDKVFVIPIVHKWCGHARLDVESIRGYYGPKIAVMPLKGKTNKGKELKSIIDSIVYGNAH